MRRRWGKVLAAHSLTTLAFGSLLGGAVANCGGGNAGKASEAPSTLGDAASAGPVDARSVVANSEDSAAGTIPPAATTVTAEAGGSPDAPNPPAHVVGTCSSLPAVGTWEQVTPPQVLQQLPGPGTCTYGTISFVLDPSSSGTLYLGTCNMGVWKTSDCGATWTHINSGRNGAAIDGGRQWTFVIDPTDPKIMYVDTGYGSASNGVYKSIDGGVDWDLVWPPADPNLANIVDYNFVHQIRMDPTDHQHLLISFHAGCKAPYTQNCIAESHDAAATWTMLNGDPSWKGTDDQTVWFLDTSNHWLWGSQTNGLWSTVDSGKTWKLINANWAGHNGAQEYRSHDGSFYLAGQPGLLRSPDGVTWSLVVTDVMVGVTGDGTTMYASRGYTWTPPLTTPYEPFRSSPESDGQHWTQMTTPMMTDAGTMAYDKDHHILYSSNGYAGFWRIVTQ